MFGLQKESPESKDNNCVPRTQNHLEIPSCASTQKHLRKFNRSTNTWFFKSLRQPARQYFGGTRQIWIAGLAGLLTLCEPSSADDIAVQKKGPSSQPAIPAQDPSFQQDPHADFWQDPFLEMEKIHRDMMRLFRQSYASPQWAGSGRHSKSFSPRMDVQELPDRYLIQADLPGMDKDKLEISITDEAVTISGERSYQHQENSQEGMYMMERSFGKFQRTLPIPQNIKQEDITAKYENGVLMITLPKSDPTSVQEKARQIQVT